MTKRRFSLYVLIVGILIWSGPYFIGKYIETKYQILGQRFSEFQGTKIEPISYERHWRYSVAQTKVTFTDLAWQQVMSLGQSPWSLLKNTPEITLTLEHKIYHGPMIKGSKGWLDWTFARTSVESKLVAFDLLSDKLSKQALSDLISITSSMDLFDGELRIFLEGKAIESQAVPSLVWQGIEGQWTLNSGLTQLDAFLQIPKIKTQFDSATLDIEQLQFKTQRERKDSKIWQGFGQIGVQELSYQNQELAQDLQLSGAQWLGELDVHQGIAKTHHSVDFQQLTYEDTAYGPLHVEFSIDSIPSDLIQVMQTLLADLPEKNRLSYVFLNEKILASLPRLLAQRPSITVKQFQCSTPEGMIEGHFYGTIGGTQAFELSQPQAIFASAQVELQAIMPKSVFESLLQTYFEHATSEPSLNSEEAAFDYALQTIQAWLRQGYLLEDEGRYRVQLWLDKGMLSTSPPN